MKAVQKLGNPAFILSVLILVLNDWYLKQTFANGLTGKLSDFAGLFAFPFFFSAFLPKHTLKIYLGTFLLFLAWKSAFIQPFIDILNGLGVPVYRTVDYTDYVAMAILPFSFYLFNKNAIFPIKRMAFNGLVIVSLFAFTATEMPPGSYVKFTGIDKIYNFNFSKKELIERLNMLQLEYVHDFNKYSGSEKADFDSKSNIFYFYRGDKKDTLAVMLDYKKVNDADTIKLRTLFAQINVSGNKEASELKLLSLYQFVRRSDAKEGKAKAIDFFEKYVIKRLKNYK